jgi:predicted ArsR family transcriptional regulator
MAKASGNGSIEDLDIGLESDRFLRMLVGELANALEDVVGLEESAGLISVVGQKIGERINDEYLRALALPSLSRRQVADVLVDLKRRIRGDFFIVEESDTKIVLGNRRCPFGEQVIGRPSMCMMTSNVFGVIAAENLGRAKVSLDATIAEGAAGCRVTVYLKPGTESDTAAGREYFKS